MTVELWDAAVEVLRENDLGGWTKPAPRLYPYQWSWDSAFIAIGLVHVDPRAAVRELETLFSAQWADGRVPHIVFNNEAPNQDYFPDPGWWASQKFSPPAPANTPTSGLVQPPVHAIAAWHMAQVAGETACATRLRALYPRLVAGTATWRRTATRMGAGSIVVYHPWESMDNSPRFDAALARVEVGELPPYTRRDTGHIQDTSQRPTDAEYDRFLWLVNLLKAARYDDAADPAHAAAAGAGRLLQRHLRRRQPRPVAAGWLAGTRVGSRRSSTSGPVRFSNAVQQQWDATERLALDYDVRADAPIRVQTYAGFAPLLVPGLDAGLRDRLVGELFGPRFVRRRRLQVCGDPECRARARPASSRAATGADRSGRS